MSSSRSNMIGEDILDFHDWLHTAANKACSAHATIVDG